MSIDPLAAFGGQDSWSPYAAMGNSPGMMVDPLGLQFQSGRFARTIGDIHVTILGNRYPESRFFVYSDPNFARTLEILKEYAYLSRRIHELRNPVPSLETAGGGIQGPIAPTVFRGFYPVPAPVRPVSSGSGIDFTWQGSGFYRNFGGLQASGGTDFWTGLGYAGLVTTATGGLTEAYGLGKQSLWQSRYGWRSGYTAPISRWTTLGRGLGNVGLGVGIVGLGNDARQVSQGEISGWRFGYHLAGFGTSVYVGAQLGGPYGAAVGVGFGVAELGYDHVVKPYIVEPARQEFNRGFNSWLRGVYRGMGIPGY